MAISSIRTSFASLAALLSLLAGCAGTPADNTAAAGQPVAQTSCNHDDDRPSTGTSINHHDCKNHSNVVSMDPGNLEMSRNTGGNAQAGHN